MYIIPFDFEWAAGHLLSLPARAEYRRIMAAAWVECECVTASARAEYKRVMAAAFGRLYHE